MKRKATPKQRQALQYGMHIRNMRGAIAALSRITVYYPDPQLVYTVAKLKDIHDRIFGPVKCYVCGKPARHLESRCGECQLNDRWE